jgi:hypothetical protein
MVRTYRISERKSFSDKPSPYNTYNDEKRVKKKDREEGQEREEDVNQ